MNASGHDRNVCAAISQKILPSRTIIVMITPTTTLEMHIGRIGRTWRKTAVLFFVFPSINLINTAYKNPNDLAKNAQKVPVKKAVFIVVMIDGRKLFIFIMRLNELNVNFPPVLGDVKAL